MKALPNTSFLPVPKSAPAGHTTSAAHLLWQVFPRYPCLEYKDNSGQSCPVRYTWTASFGRGLMFWQKWFNLTPQFVAYQFPGHLLHPHWYFTVLGALRGNPFLRAVARQKFLPPNIPLGTKFAAEPCTRPGGLAHSHRQISLVVSRPSAHVGWMGLFNTTKRLADVQRSISLAVSCPCAYAVFCRYAFCVLTVKRLRFTSRCVIIIIGFL